MRITKLIGSPDDLKSAIFEAEETKDAILDKITKVRTFIDQHAHRQLKASPTPTSTVNDNKLLMLDISPHQSTIAFPKVIATTTIVTTSIVTKALSHLRK